MPDYRRNRVPGGTYFFTVTLRDRRASLLVTHVDLLRAAVRQVRHRLPFHIDAWVVLPDHLHCVWTLPADDVDFPTRWRDIKIVFAKEVLAADPAAAASVRKGGRRLWQRGYWEHTIRDARDYAVHMDYVHFNPVKHGYVDHPAKWPPSSFRWCVKRGMYPVDWAGDPRELNRFGERGDA